MGQSQSDNEGEYRTYHRHHRHHRHRQRNQYSNNSTYNTRSQIYRDTNAPNTRRSDSNYSNLRRAQQIPSHLRQQQQSSQPTYMFYYDRATNTVRRMNINPNLNSNRDYNRVSRLGRAARSRQQNNNLYRNNNEIRQIIQRQQQRQILRQIQQQPIQHHQSVSHLGRRRRRRQNSPVQNLDNIIGNNRNDFNNVEDEEELQRNREKMEELLYMLPSADLVEREKQGSCSICLIEMMEEFEAGDRAVVIPCYHVFHKNCIKQWMEAQGQAADCPLCGTLINQDEGRLLLQLAEQE